MLPLKLSAGRWPWSWHRNPANVVSPLVSPGFIDTGKLLAHLPPTDRASQLSESKGADSPTRRVGQPEDAAATYLFAMSEPLSDRPSTVCRRWLFHHLNVRGLQIKR